MIILIHSSKTMRPIASTSDHFDQPELLECAVELHNYLKTLTTDQIMKVMAISEPLAIKTKKQIDEWSSQWNLQRPAVDSFLGDIYSGLQVQLWSVEDREYANRTLRILSGLYGILRPLDGIAPYRFEMGYKLPDEPYRTAYKYWGNVIAATLPQGVPIINLAAVEYSKTITPYVDTTHITTPSFLTRSQKTGKLTFVTVHTKIARGAFASWLITNRINDLAKLREFNGLGYRYDEILSTVTVPVFTCEVFGGLGLSMRLK